MSELKPCPFCGGEAELIEHRFCDIPNTYGVRCPICRVQTDQFYAEKESAVFYWNRRKEGEQK